MYFDGWGDCGVSVPTTSLACFSLPLTRPVTEEQLWQVTFIVGHLNQVYLCVCLCVSVCVCVCLCLCLCLCVSEEGLNEWEEVRKRFSKTKQHYSCDSTSYSRFCLLFSQRFQCNALSVEEFILCSLYSLELFIFMSVILMVLAVKERRKCPLSVWHSAFVPVIWRGFCFFCCWR